MLKWGHGGGGMGGEGSNPLRLVSLWKEEETPGCACTEKTLLIATSWYLFICNIRKIAKEVKIGKYREP